MVWRAVLAPRTARGSLAGRPAPRDQPTSPANIINTLLGRVRGAAAVVVDADTGATGPTRTDPDGPDRDERQTNRMVWRS